MYEVLAQMAALIACGVLWRALRPLGLDADETRRVLTSVVYVLLLPALVLLVLWRAPLGLDTLRISFLAASGVLAGMLAAWLSYRTLGTERRIAGAMILAAAFPNATYLGLPVLENTLGDWARTVAIQYDLFACTPLLLTVGVLLARAHGEGNQQENPLASLLKVPPLWAALLAAALNLGGAPLPDWLAAWLEMLAVGVIPLMLISLGMGLRFDTFRRGAVPLMLPVLVIQLLAMPALVWLLAGWIGLDGPWRAAAVLEAAMPCMVLGLVICDRYRLDSALYAAVVTVSTVLSLLSLPLWFDGLKALLV